MSGQSNTNKKGDSNTRGVRGACFTCGAFDHFQRDCPQNQSLYGVTEGEEEEQWQEEGSADMDSNKQDYEYVTRTNTHTPQTQSSDSVTNVKSAHTALPKPINIPVANNKPVKIKSVREKVQFATNGNSTNKQEQIPTPTPTPAPKNGTKLLVCKMKVFGHTARVLIEGVTR